MLKKTVSSCLTLCFLTMHPFVFAIAPKPVFAEEVNSASIVISAVQITGGEGETNEDFIELYNASPNPVDLSGFRLVKRSATASTDSAIKAWSTETIVQPYHFYLWANSSFSSIPKPTDVTTSSTLADNNGVALRQGSNDTGIIYDSLAWGNTANGFENVNEINPGAGQSLSLSNPADINSEYIIQTSNPRNSADKFIPEDDPAPEETPTEDPPVEETPPSDEYQPEEPPTPKPEQVNIQITEILPNPFGEDSGFEKIEFHNSGTEAVNLIGYKLDDVPSTEPLSINSYILPELLINPDEYLTITIPVGKFALNNTDGDVLTLFAPDNSLTSTAFYEVTAPENQSYSYFESGWQWTDSTFGQNNGEPPVLKDENNPDEEEQETPSTDYDNFGVVINEIFPHPEAKDSEFIEIYNSGIKTAQLSEVEVWVGTRHKVVGELELKPGEYYVIEQSDFPIQLRNSGQDIKLLEAGKVLSAVTYPLSVKGASFAKFEDGFLWTIAVTKSKENILKLPEEIKKKSETEATKTTEKKVEKKQAASKTAAKPASSMNTSLKDTKNQNKEILAQEKALSDASKPEHEASKQSLGKIIAMGAAAVTAGVIALYKFVITGGIE